GDFTSLGVGFEYLPARVKLTTRYELRLGDVEDQHVLTAAGATRLTDALSLFTRERLYLVNPAAADARLDGDGLLGLAYRPLASDRLNFLFKLQGTKGDGIRGGGSPLARSYLGVFEANVEPVSRLHLLGRLALREQQDLFEDTHFFSRALLGETRALVDIGSRWNAGLTVRALEQPTISSRLSGFGVGSGCRLVKDTWLVGGYNVTGFSEAGFGDSDQRSAGPFLTVRFKFDEDTFVGLGQELRKRDPVEERLPSRDDPALPDHEKE